MVVRDERGKVIQPGDVLKVFHFVGVNRKRHFMYKQAVEYVKDGRWLKISHLNRLNDEPWKIGTNYYLEQADGQLRQGVEIVQRNSTQPNRPPMDWQPIETAPINTPLLVWHPGLGMGGWNVMRFDGEEWRETAHDGRALKGGYEPSHWQPLPPPPKDQPTG